MRVLVLITIALTCWTQYRFWLGDSGYFAVATLRERVAQQDRANTRLAERNRVLVAEVAALRDGLDAVEAKARVDLGMIGADESFFLVVESDDDAEARP